MNNSPFPLYIEQSDLTRPTSEEINDLIAWHKKTEESILVLKANLEKIKDGIRDQCKHSPAMANAIIKKMEEK